MPITTDDVAYQQAEKLIGTDIAAPWHDASAVRVSYARLTRCMFQHARTHRPFNRRAITVDNTHIIQVKTGFIPRVLGLTKYADTMLYAADTRGVSVPLAIAALHETVPTIDTNNIIDAFSRTADYTDSCEVSS